jgi:hypothetical protein
MNHRFLSTALAVTIVLAGACGSNVDLDGGPGPVGPVGPQGDQGPQGDIGPQDGANVVPGSGVVITETREVSNFDRIDLKGEGNVIVSVGASFSLTIETDDNLMQYLDTAVEGDTLVLATVSAEPIDIEPTNSITWSITMPAVAGVTISGAGSIGLRGLGAERIDAAINGAGDIDLLEIDVAYMDAAIRGAGMIRATGTADRASLAIEGVGSIEAGDLETIAVSCVFKTAGDMVVWATDELAVTGDSMGTVSVYGSPEMSGDRDKVTLLGDK